MPRVMKTLAGAAVLLIAVAGCQAPQPSGPANAEAIFKAPGAAIGSGIDPETQGPQFDTNTTAAPPTESLMASPIQTKEITVDPRDARTKIDLARTLMGEEWLFVSKTVKDAGVVTWKFMRRDIARVDVDPFGIPDIYKASKEPPKPVAPK
jgi:hypothetical protein